MSGGAGARGCEAADYPRKDQELGRPLAPPPLGSAALALRTQLCQILASYTTKSLGTRLRLGYDTCVKSFYQTDTHVAVE